MMTRRTPIRQHNPWIVYTVRDLFAIFGLAVWVFVALQGGAALIAGKFAMEHLKIPLAITAGGYMVICLMVDSIIYMVHRGRLYTAFIRPALLVLIFTVAPFVLLWLGHFIFDLQSRR